MDIESYNRMRREQTLLRQKAHLIQMRERTEHRLIWLKSRMSAVEGQLRTLEHGKQS